MSIPVVQSGVQGLCQFIQRKIGPLPSAHFDRFALSHQTDGLMQQRMDKIGVIPQRLDAQQHLRGNGMVIGTKDVDDNIKAPLGLVHVVSDIR